MSDYIVVDSTTPNAYDGDASYSLTRPVNRSDTADTFRFPILASLLRNFADMSEGVPQSGKGSGRRGRRPRAKVPCDECITRASRKNEPAATLVLCESCTSILHRPRARKQQEAANTRKVRKQSHAGPETGPGVHTEPVAMPCKSITAFSPTCF